MNPNEGYFEQPAPRHTRKVQLNIRIPPELKDELLAVVALWAAIAEAQGLDPAAQDLTHVCIRLLRKGANDAWEQALEMVQIEDPPVTEEDWVALKKALARYFKKNGTK